MANAEKCFYDQDNTVDSLDLSVEQFEKPDEPISTQIQAPERHRANGRIQGLALLAVVAIAGSSIYSSLVDRVKRPTLSKDKTEQPAPATINPSAPPTTIAPLGTYNPNLETTACYTHTYTVQPGDTIFGLSTQGLQGDSYFMNSVFAWNLQNLAQKAQQDSSLKDPNIVAINKKVPILDNCILVGPIFGTYSHTPYRTVEFQSYQSADGRNHNNLTTVYYGSSATGDFIDVLDCRPQPDCTKYVEGMPSQVNHNVPPYLP
jgi:hypothetical protein